MTTRHVKSSFFFDVISSFDKQENCANFLINFLAFLMSDRSACEILIWVFFIYIKDGDGWVVAWKISSKIFKFFWLSLVFLYKFSLNFPFLISFWPLPVQTFLKISTFLNSRVTPKFHSLLLDRFLESKKKMRKQWRAKFPKRFPCNLHLSHRSLIIPICFNFNAD